MIVVGDTEDEGHAWIIDGYDDVSTMATQIYRYYDQNIIVFKESDFYQIYQLKVEEQVVYQDDKVLDDTVWDKWLNAPEAYRFLVGIFMQNGMPITR